MNLWKNRKGISLVEVLIAISLFVIVATLSSNILIDTAKLQKKSSISSAIYEDLRIITQQITNEIQNGAIDYEEYYNAYVLHDGKAEQDTYYGINYGAYGSRFYDPGSSLDGAPTKHPDDLGTECSYPKTIPAGEDCQVIYTISTDLNVGASPYIGDPDSVNAFCDGAKGKCSKPGEVDELFLIDKTGTKKTIIGRKKTSNKDWAIGMVKMDGIDVDQNGVIDTFKCAKEYACTGDGTGESDILAKVIKLPFFDTKKDIEDYGVRLPKRSDLNAAFDINSTQFVPITPLRTNVKELKFIIHPLDDPYKAYSEPKMQAHPSVTILLTIELADAVKDLYPGEFEELHIQTTVSAGVLNTINSYPPTSEVKHNGNKDTWLKDVF